MRSSQAAKVVAPSRPFADQTAGPRRAAWQGSIVPRFEVAVPRAGRVARGIGEVVAGHRLQRRRPVGAFRSPARRLDLGERVAQTLWMTDVGSLALKYLPRPSTAVCQ